MPLLAKWQNVFQTVHPYLLILVPRLKLVASALLNHERLRIVTNNINAAHLLRQNETFDITMAGGSLRGMVESLVRQRLILFRNSV